MSKVSLAILLDFLAGCASGPDEWSKAAEVEADWLANHGLALHSLPAIPVVPHDKLQESVRSRELTDWLAGREVQPLTYGKLRIIQLSDRLGTCRNRDTLVRDLAGVA